MTDEELEEMLRYASLHEASIDGPDLILDGVRFPHLYAVGDAWTELAVLAPSLVASLAATRSALRQLLDLVERDLVSDLSDNDLAIAYACSGQADVENDAIAEQEVRMLVAEAKRVLVSDVSTQETK